MKYTVVNGTEWTYPDRTEYRSGSSCANLQSARNSYASCQIVFAGLSSFPEVAIEARGDISAFPAEYYELVPVYVEGNLPELDEKSRSAYIPSRIAPFYIYDCAKPLGKTLTPKNGGAGLYVAFRIPDSAEPGEYAGTLAVRVGSERLEIPVKLRVYAARVPDKEHLKIINGYNSGKTAEYHKVAPGSDENRALDEKYLRMLRRMRQNMLYVGGVKRLDPENGHLRFDFSDLEKNVEFYMSLGYKYFNMSSVGGRKSWHESTILVAGYPAMSYEAYRYLADYLPALQNFLDAKGWIDNFYMGVSDEPNDKNATEYRALCGLVRKFAPRISLLDALSYVPVHGALDVWVPLNAEYDKHREEFESFRVGNDEIWHYVCCGPRGELYINRLMDYPLLSTRYLFWGNYRYNLGGYLHWASNCYQPGQDPFTQNNPTHRNCDATCTLPAGDTHIIYPGDDGPWMSLRLEAQRQSAEDFELLRLISLKDKALADKICEEGFRSFNNVEYDPVRFESIRADLLGAASL
jgi:hypothetical protein